MPRLALLTTGGTIAGTGPLHHYQAGQLPAEALLSAIPELSALAEWQVESVFSLDSRDITPKHWLLLAARVQALLSASDIDGIVITHGTDTLEETAFALHLLLDCSKPVVLTAAMRPASSLSADGPLNLLQAAVVARDAQSGGRGVLVVANDEVHSARYVAKTHTHAPDALTSPFAGPEGHIFDRALRFMRPASRNQIRLLTVPDGASLPAVPIVTAYAGLDEQTLKASCTDATRGIILALAGHGSVPHAIRAAVQNLVSKGVMVVRASRIGAGVMHNHNEDDDQMGLLAAERLNPLQARVLLLLSLAAGLSRDQIRYLLGSV